VVEFDPKKDFYKKIDMNEGYHFVTPGWMVEMGRQSGLPVELHWDWHDENIRMSTFYNPLYWQPVKAIEDYPFRPWKLYAPLLVEEDDGHWLIKFYNQKKEQVCLRGIWEVPVNPELFD